MILSIIAAIGKNRELGKDNKLLWEMPADMKHFRDTTRGHAVIMGRKTFESLPNGPLPNRRNIVITRDENYLRHGVDVVHSIDEALRLAPLAQGEPEEEFFVIGGAEIYKQAIEKADKLYITKVDGNFYADTFFPEINENIWKEDSIESHEPDEKNPLPYTFVTYIKKLS